MRLQIPPIIPYFVGAMLVFFGILRVKYLAAPRIRQRSEDEQDAAVEEVPVRGKEQRRHLRMGVVWVLLGLFLLVSTFVQTHRH
jgi:hypothetical protein